MRRGWRIKFRCFITGMASVYGLCIRVRFAPDAINTDAFTTTTNEKFLLMYYIRTWDLENQKHRQVHTVWKLPGIYYNPEDNNAVRI